MYEALAKAQADFKPIHRNKTVSVRMDAGGTYSFAYAPLETILDAIVPSLNANGLSLTQDVVEDDKGREFVMTYLRHPSTAEVISSRSRIILGKKDGPQAYGSATTYARRYGVTWLFCLSTDEDDDGNAAEGNETTVVKQKEEFTDALTDPANTLADKFIAAAHAGLDEPIWDIHEEANQDGYLYKRAWSLIPAPDRRYIKGVIDKVKASKNGTVA